LSGLASQRFEETASLAWEDPSFISALKIIYEETSESDRGLKDIAIKVATAFVDEFLAKKEFTELCESNGALSLDVLKATRPSSTPQPPLPELLPVQFGDSCRKCGDEYYPDPTADDTYGYMCAGCGTQVVLEIGDTEEEIERFVRSRYSGLGRGLRRY
jgi:hypothetical protein